MVEHLRWALSSSFELFQRPCPFCLAAFHSDLMEVTINCSSHSQYQLWSSSEVWVWITLLRFKRLHHALSPRPPLLCAFYWSSFIRLCGAVLTRLSRERWLLSLKLERHQHSLTFQNSQNKNHVRCDLMCILASNGLAELLLLFFVFPVMKTILLATLHAYSEM